MSLTMALVLGAACAGGVQVQVRPVGTIDVDAKAASLAALLECLSERTGLKVVNATGAMSPVKITLSLSGKTEVQVVSELMAEGRMNYGLTTDLEGNRVKVLLLQGVRSANSGAATDSSGSSASRVTAPVVTEWNQPAGAGNRPVEGPDPSQGAGAGANNVGMAGPAVWNQNPSAPPVTEPYPQPHALSPMTLRDAGRVPLLAGRATAPKARGAATR
jgi:hypothetical protein